MGKKSKYPAYSSGSMNINGVTKAGTLKIGNDISSNYNMSADEQRAY